MTVNCIWEHNGGDTLLHIEGFFGAFTRGPDLEAAIEKVASEISDYCKWSDTAPPDSIEINIIQEQSSELDIRDADSDVLFESEKAPLTVNEYEKLKALCLKSARDFKELYDSIPNKDRTNLPERKTFYGDVPRTANEMYMHTKNVNEYYFGEIGVDADNDGDIFDCRARAFAALEKTPDYLKNKIYDGSYGEKWTLRKVLRRFIWHDRIHARAMRKLKH